MKKLLLGLAMILSLVGCEKEIPMFKGGKTIGNQFTAVVCTSSTSSEKLVVITNNPDNQYFYAPKIVDKVVESEPDTIWEFYNNVEDLYFTFDENGNVIDRNYEIQ